MIARFVSEVAAMLTDAGLQVSHGTLSLYVTDGDTIFMVPIRDRLIRCDALAAVLKMFGLDEDGHKCRTVPSYSYSAARPYCPDCGKEW